MQQSLLDLSNIHQELDELFFRHQAAVLKLECTSAQNLLRTYETALRGHLKEEEEILMPLYLERVTPIRGGDPEHFILEHQKIDEWLNRLKLRLYRLNSQSTQRDIIALLDDEAHFKKYLEHHSLREERILYPELERVISENEKSALLRLLSFSIDSLSREIKF